MSDENNTPVEEVETPATDTVADEAVEASAEETTEETA